MSACQAKIAKTSVSVVKFRQEIKNYGMAKKSPARKPVNKYSQNPQCVGRTSSGRQCRNSAFPGSDKCKARHNGDSLKGNDSPHYSGKGWSSYLPKEMIDRFKLEFENPNLFNNFDEIAYIKLMQGYLGEGLDSEGYPFHKWKNFKTLLISLGQCMFKDDDLSRARAADIYYQLTALAEMCSKDELLKKEIRSHINQSSDLIAKQKAIDVQNQQYIKRSQAMLIFDAIITGIDTILPPSMDKMVSSGQARKQLASHCRAVFNKPNVKQRTVETEYVEDDEATEADYEIITPEAESWRMDEN